VSLAIVMIGNSLAIAFHMSGALALVITGLLIGHGLHEKAACPEQKLHLTVFWKIIDEILNSVLFVLIGIEILTVSFELTTTILGLIAIVIVLFSRFTSLLFANLFLSPASKSDTKDLAILTWAGLRGGISIGLVLSLPDMEARNLLLLITYIIVVFSIVVQGLSIEKLVKKINA
jgi:CPA1 family monovalent cation:H+ antiporter